MNPIGPRNPEDNPRLNERLWQVWVCKNRELDRRTALKWRRVLQAVLGLVVVVLVMDSLRR